MFTTLLASAAIALAGSTGNVWIHETGLLTGKYQTPTCNRLDIIITNWSELYSKHELQHAGSVCVTKAAYDGNAVGMMVEVWGESVW